MRRRLVGPFWIRMLHPLRHDQRLSGSRRHQPTTQVFCICTSNYGYHHTRALRSQSEQQQCALGCCAGLATLMMSLQRVNGAPWFNGSDRFHVISNTNHRARSAKSRARGGAGKGCAQSGSVCWRAEFTPSILAEARVWVPGSWRKPLQCRGVRLEDRHRLDMGWGPHHFQTRDGPRQQQ